MAHSDFPVKNPIITDVLAREIYQEVVDSPRKPKAFNTWFRHSDAGKCGRYLWYEHLDTPQSDPMDICGAWVTWLGTQIHEELQRALQVRYPGCKVEPKIQHGDLTSGHADAIVQHPEFGKVMFELKSRGSFGFDKAVGWRRKNWSTDMPEGPSTSDRIQGALNATAVDADLLIIGMIGFESASKGFGEKQMLSEIDRVPVAEWHFTKAEFSPWAASELARLKTILENIENHVTPARQAVGDEMQLVKLNPNASKFPCTYCSHLTTCQEATA